MQAISDLRIGVLGLQGNWRRHAEVITKLGATVGIVTASAHLEGLDGIVLPGGESTSMKLALESSPLGSKLRTMAAEGSTPMFGTCAGAILMAGTVFDGSTESPGLLGLDGCTMERNSYGSHAYSFTQEINVAGVGLCSAMFIRAPRILDTQGWRVLGETKNGDPVILRSHAHIVATFHPELTDSSVHRLFLNMCVERRTPGVAQTV